MNDEIKEILEALDSTSCCPYHDYMCKKAKNYITNLQEEIKRLKENAEHNDKVVDKARWNEMIYKSRCEKAIEWIDKHTEIYTKNEISIIDWDTFSDPRNLKNILNGGDE